jgi:hypothetical protein
MKRSLSIKRRKQIRRRPPQYVAATASGATMEPKPFMAGADRSSTPLPLVPPESTPAPESVQVASEPSAASVFSVESGLTADAFIPGRGVKAGRRTSVSKSTRTNRVAIILSTSSVVLLIDEKLASLRDERPNDLDAQAARNDAILHYESLKQDVNALREMVLQLDNATKRSVESTANRFVRGIQSWWDKRHQKICDKAFDAAIFMSCVGLCSLVGSGGTLAVAVSGALIGGKTVVEAIKAIPKRPR